MLDINATKQSEPLTQVTIMKKTILSLVTLTSLLFTQAASAAILPYMDYVDVDKVSVVLNSANPTASGTWDIVNDDGDGAFLDAYGFDPLTETITNVAALFVFFDRDEQGNVLWVDKININVGSWSNLVSGTAGGFDVLLNGGNFGGFYANIIADVQADGLLDWSVTLDNPQNSVTLHTASLGVQVPDTGSTLTLMGFAGILLIGAVRFTRSR